MALVDSRAPTTDDLGLREELSRMQVMLLQYAHLVLELRQQLPSGHERPEQIPPKLDALRSAISVSTPQHRPAAITLDAGFGQHAPKLATPSGAPVSMMHGAHVPDAVQAELPQPAHPAAQPRPHSRPRPMLLAAQTSEVWRRSPLLLPTATLGALIRLVLRLCGRERWVQFGPPPGAAKANSTA